jgi:hypothetical protein
MIDMNELTDFEKEVLTYVKDNGGQCVGLPTERHHAAALEMKRQGLLFVVNSYDYGLTKEGERFASTLVPTASGNGGAGDARSLRQQTATDAGIIDHLSSQIVHAQMLLQTALGYEEVDYHISLNDLETDILALRQQVASLRAALDFYADDDNWTVKSPKYGEAYSLVDKDMGEQARKALGEADNGS